MSIWLVEDDPVQAVTILDRLRERFSQEEFRHLKCEREFLDALAEASPGSPALIILDVMLPWTEIETDVRGRPFVAKPPDDYNQAGGFYRAGFRCLQALGQRPQTQAIPVVLLTVLTDGDLADDLRYLPPHVRYLSKRDPPERLLELLKPLTRH